MSWWDGWDDSIPQSLKARWERWRGDLHLLSSLKIPRCYKQEGFGEPKTVDLHHFSDASKDAYGQCSYLRLTNDSGQIHCSLAMAKSRMGPLKPVTIPRLKLAAALVSLKISDVLHWELEYDQIKEVFWTDSKVVIGYVSNDARRFCGASRSWNYTQLYQILRILDHWSELCHIWLHFKMRKLSKVERSAARTKDSFHKTTYNLLPLFHIAPLIT